MEKLQLVDFSSEDDFLVAASLEDFRLSDNFFPVKMEKKDEHKKIKQFVNAKRAAEIFDKREEKLSLSRSNGVGRATNSRDSLAWDSAFFTNAGVLDPDELFTLNKGFEKPEVRKRKSTYSEYLFDTEGLFLETQSNGSDLFQDVRASIRKSSKMSNMRSEGHKQKAHVSKKLDYMTRNRVKFTPTATKQEIHKQGSKLDAKNTSSPFISQIREKNGKSKAFSPRPPKISGRINIAPTGSTRNCPPNINKLQKSTASSSGQSFVSSKNSRLGKSSCSTGSSSFSLTASSDSLSYCSPFSSATSLRSSSNSKIKSNTTKNTLSGSVPMFKTPLKCSLQVQNDLEDLNSSTHLSSFSNHSSYYSTTSTMEEYPSASSSVSYNNADRNANFGERNGDVSAELARGFKPSGLRPPSPKIGFFDKEHSSEDYKFHIGSQIDSPKINGITNKRKPWDSTSVATSASDTHAYMKPNIVTNNNSPKLRLKLKKDVTPSMRESILKARKVNDDAKVENQRGVQSSSSTEKKRIKAVLENKIEKEKKRHIHLGTIIPCISKNKILKSEENEKENLASLQDKVEGLSRYFDGINLKSDAFMEISRNGLSKLRARSPLAEKNCVREGINSK